jgi:uncharacterized membrane protein (Fun14 family)
MDIKNKINMCIFMFIIFMVILFSNKKILKIIIIIITVYWKPYGNIRKEGIINCNAKQCEAQVDILSTKSYPVSLFIHW